MLIAVLLGPALAGHVLAQAYPAGNGTIIVIGRAG